jgi:hypothetical protein
MPRSVSDGEAPVTVTGYYLEKWTPQKRAHKQVRKGYGGVHLAKNTVSHLFDSKQHASNHNFVRSRQLRRFLSDVSQEGLLDHHVTCRLTCEWSSSLSVFLRFDVIVSTSLAKQFTSIESLWYSISKKLQEVSRVFLENFQKFFIFLFSERKKPYCVVILHRALWSRALWSRAL